MIYNTWNGKQPIKTCPGSLITDAWLKQLLTRPAPVVPSTVIPTQFCTAEKNVIELQKSQISSLNSIIQNLKNFITSLINNYNRK
jgi:hypothetical protein